MKRRGKGDPAGTADESFDVETVEHIKALMDRPVIFHRIESVDKSDLRKPRETPAPKPIPVNPGNAPRECHLCVDHS